MAATRVPLHDITEGLLRENFSAHGERPDDPFLGSCFDSRARGVQETLSLVDAVRRVHANPTFNDAQHIIQTNKLLKPHIEKLSNGWRALSSRAAELAVETKDLIDVKVRPAPGYEAGLAAELRGYLRSLPEAERDGAISKALKQDGNLLVLKAVAGAPPMLSGIHPARHAIYRKDAIGVIDPNYIGREEAFRDEAQRLDRAAAGLQRIFRERFNFDQAEALSKLAG